MTNPRPTILSGLRALAGTINQHRRHALDRLVRSAHYHDEADRALILAEMPEAELRALFNLALSDLAKPEDLVHSDRATRRELTDSRHALADATLTLDIRTAERDRARGLAARLEHALDGLLKADTWDEVDRIAHRTRGPLRAGWRVRLGDGHLVPRLHPTEAIALEWIGHMIKCQNPRRPDTRWTEATVEAIS